MRIYNSNVPKENFFFVDKKADLPAALGGVINLPANYTYFFTDEVDLTGDRLVCGANTTILGSSSENCRIKSTGLSGTALISSNFSLPMRGITIEADVALNLSGDGTTTAIDWFGVNFTNCATVGTIKSYSNIVFTDCAFLDSANLTFDGTIGSVAMGTCLFRGSAGSIFILPSTLTISRRFRVIYSSFVSTSGEVSLNVNTGATIPNDSYILTYCNFAGGGTYLSGVTQTDLRTLFINNVGITNTSNVGHFWMVNNATTSPTTTLNAWVKANGTTIIGLGNSPKWLSGGTSNRLTYTGTVESDFIISVVGTVLVGANNVTLGVGIAENGTLQTEASVSVRCPTSAQPFPFSLQDVITVSNGNFYEIFIRNETGTQAATLSDVNVIIQKVTG